MEKSADNENGCCKDEQKQVKLDDDQKPAACFYSWNFLTQATLLTTAFYPDHVSGLMATAEKFPVSHAPPFPGDPTTYLLICVFRI